MLVADGVIASGSLLAAIPIALLAGVASFASPCVLPLVPGYLGYLGGMSATNAAPASIAVGQVGATVAFGRAQPQVRRGRLVLGVGLFVLGFSIIFVAMGVLAGTVGFMLARWQTVITQVMGVAVIAMGLAFVGLVPALSAERKPHFVPRAGLLGAPLLGMTFGIGWTPCLGPTLATISTLALTDGSASRGALLALVYCLGLGLPFLAIALGLESSKKATAWLRQHRTLVQRSGGGLLVLLGVAMLTGTWGRISAWLESLLPGYTPTL